MKIIYEESFGVALLQILHYIAKDKKSSAQKFKKDLKTKIELLEFSPYMCKKSIYFEDDCYRDLTFKGYTIIYKVEKDLLKILDIFKWEER